MKDIFDFIRMLFWEVFFIFFILPWAYIPIVLGCWDDQDKEPKWIRWIINRALGRFE